MAPAQGAACRMRPRDGEDKHLVGHEPTAVVRPGARFLRGGEKTSSMSRRRTSSTSTRRRRYRSAGWTRKTKTSTCLGSAGRRTTPATFGCRYYSTWGSRTARRSLSTFPSAPSGGRAPARTEGKELGPRIGEPARRPLVEAGAGEEKVMAICCPPRARDGRGQRTAGQRARGQMIMIPMIPPNT